jgi:hypothetical protein
LDSDTVDGRTYPKESTLELSSDNFFARSVTAFPFLPFSLFSMMLSVMRRGGSRCITSGMRWSSTSASGFSLALSDEQKAFQELARNFAKTEMIPKAAVR